MKRSDRKPSLEVLVKLSEIFNCSINHILCKTDVRNSNVNISAGNFSNIPVVSKIAAEQPILAEEYIEGYLPVDPNIYGLTSTENLFYLFVSGQSMNLKVKNGDYALIHKQDYAENGDIVAAIVNEEMKLL